MPELAELPEIRRADPKNCSAGIDVAVITAPLALPFFGNLPAMFIDGSLTFYFNLVIACVLGLSLFKCADRLGIEVD